MAGTYAKIAPREVKLPNEIKAPEAPVGRYLALGCAVWFGLYLALAAVLVGGLFGLGRQKPEVAFPVALFLAIPAAILIARIYYRKKRDRLRSVHISELVSALEAASVREAESATSRVVQLVEVTERSVASLPSLVERVGEEVRRARAEYAEHAFAPFWDAVERATHHIATYRETVSGINARAVEYYRVLQGRQHDFGQFSVRSNDLPELELLLGEYREVVRLGQTDFHFASIYEQRKTQEVLIAGFRTLGDAIENVRYAVEQSVAELENTIRSGFEEATRRIEDVGAQAKEAVVELRSQTDKLDNIQRGRKPPSLGG